MPSEEKTEVIITKKPQDTVTEIIEIKPEKAKEDTVEEKITIKRPKERKPSEGKVEAVISKKPADEVQSTEFKPQEKEVDVVEEKITFKVPSKRKPSTEETAIVELKRPEEQVTEIVDIIPKKEKITKDIIEEKITIKKPKGRKPSTEEIAISLGKKPEEKITEEEVTLKVIDKSVEDTTEEVVTIKKPEMRKPSVGEVTIKKKDVTVVEITDTVLEATEKVLVEEKVTKLSKLSIKTEALEAVPKKADLTEDERKPEKEVEETKTSVEEDKPKPSLPKEAPSEVVHIPEEKPVEDTEVSEVIKISKKDVAEEKAVVKLKRKPSVKKPEEKEETIVEETTQIKLKKKPVVKEVTETEEKITLIPEEEKPTEEEIIEDEFKVKISKKPTPKLKEEVVEAAEITLIKDEKLPEVVEEKVEVTIKKQEVIEKKVEEITTAVSLKKKKKPKPEKEETVEEKIQIEPSPKEEAPVEEAQIALKPKKKPVEEEKPKVEEHTEEFAITVATKPKDLPEAEEEEASLVIQRKVQDSYVVTEESVDVTVRKEIIIEKAEYEAFKATVQDITPKQMKPEIEESKFVTEEIEETEKVVKLKPAEKPKKPDEVVETVTMKAVEVQKEVVEETAQITVKKKPETEKVEEVEEKPVTKKIKLPKKKQESPVKETFAVPIKKEEPVEDQVEETVAIKLTPKEKEVIEAEVTEPVKVTLQPEKPKKYDVVEEKAEITIKKKEEKEVTQTAVIKKKKVPKKEEDQEDVSVEIKLERPKVVEEKPEEVTVEETFAVEMPKKEPKVQEIVEEKVVIDVQKRSEKQYTVTEEDVEVTVKKEIIIEEQPVVELMKPVTTKEPEKLEPKIEEVEEIPKKPVIKKEETVVEKVKLAKKPKPKKPESPVKEEFAVVLPRKESIADEEPVEESFVVEIPRPVKKEEVIESAEFTIEKEEVREYKVETVEAAVTVKKEIIVEEIRPQLAEETPLPVEEAPSEEKPLPVEEAPKEKPVQKEETEVTTKLKRKKKPEVKPSEEPVAETFAIPMKKPEPVEEPKEEVFAVVLPDKRKPEKEPEEATESFGLVIKEKEKPKIKSVETVEEKFTAVIHEEKTVKEEEVKVEEVTLPKKIITEEQEQKSTLKLKKKPKEKETKEVHTIKVQEEPSEKFEIPLAKKPEESVEEKFTIDMPRKAPKVQEDVEEELKVVIPEKKETEYKITEESAEVTVKKKVEEKIQKVEEEEVAVVLKKKKPEKEVKEPVTEEFKIPKKPEQKEEEPTKVSFKVPKKPEEKEPEETTKISVELPKRKPTSKTEEEETFKLELPSEKKFEVVEESAEVTVKKEVEITEVEKALTVKKVEKKVTEEKEEAFTIKKKKKEEKKVVDVVEEFKIPKKPEKAEKEPEEAVEIVAALPKKKKVPEFVEEEESLKITLPREDKPKVVEESAEIVIRKEVEPQEIQEIEESVTLKKDKKKIVEKKEEKIVTEEFKIPKKPKEDVPEEPKKPEEEKPKKPESIEPEESLKVTLPRDKKPDVTEESAEVTIRKQVEVEDISEKVTIKKDKKKVVEEKESVVVLKKKKVEKKTVEEHVTEKFKIPKQPEESPEPEEPVQLSIGLPQKKKAPSYAEEEESFEIKLPEKKKPQLVEETAEMTVTKPAEKKKPEVTEEAAELTVKKEVVVEEEEQKSIVVKKGKKVTAVEEERVEVAIKRPKKKPEVKESPVEESFTIGRKPEPVPEPESPKDVEETFKIVTKPKPKPKLIPQEDEESFSLQLPSEKPKYKSEEVSEETMITLEAPKKPQEKEVEMIKETIELIAMSSFVAEKTDTISIVEGEHVYLIEKTSSDWWFVKKTLTNETGFIPSNILQDSDSYTHYMKETLDKKIEKLPVLRKPRPGEKMTGPKFVKKLQPLRVIDGQTAELTCQVSGNPRPTITWFRQTAILKPSAEFQIFYDDDNVTTLIIREVFPEDAGTFTVVVKNAAGFSSCSAELIVEAPFSDHGSEITPLSRRSLSRQSSLADILEGIPPVFSEKPKDKLVEEGKPVELVCKVSGVPEPKVTWLRNQKPLKESERIETEFISEDLDTLKVVVRIKKTKPEDAGTYDIIAENREGKSTTSLILNIKEKPKKPKEEPPTFIQTYSDLITTEKDSVSLTVKVVGTPPPEVVWYKNGKIIKPSKTTKMTQEKDIHTLTLPASDVSDTGEYKCVATNPQGKTEHTAKITVQKTDVDFVDKLNDLEVNERETAMFVVQVSHPDAEITWHKDGERIKESEKFKIVKEEKFRKLVINNASINDEGEYTCVLGEKECTADLVVVELPPDFKGEMNDVTVAKEETATFQVELTKGDARARWFKNGKEIQFSEHVLLKIDGKRQKLIIYNATFEDAGTYTCAVGEKKRTAKLKVEAPTVEFTAKLPEKVLVPQDTDTTFTVELSRPDVDVKWLKNGQPVPEKDGKFRFVREKNTFKMVVQGVQKDDTAEYTCVAGNVKTSTKLQVQEASAEFTLKLRDVIVKESDTAILLVEVTRETFEVRWMKDGQTIRPSERVVMEREGCRRRLIIKETSLDDKGLYTCVLEEKTCSSTLIVEATPRVTTEKRIFSAKRGSNLPIPIDFVALPSPKIEWLYKGKPISNDKKRTIENYKTKTVLTIKKIEDADLGNYTLKLTNKCGECKTDFTISIIDKPKPPGTPCASEVANDSLTLSWKVPENDGGSPITNYIIEFHDRNTLRWSVYNEKHTITDSFTRVSKLKPGEEYMFRIIAVNEVGKSDPSPGTKYILVKEPSAGEPPAVVEHLQPVVAGLKKPAVMKCRISGQPTPTIKWLKNGKDLLILKNITTTYENQVATLNIGETSEKSSGTYSCTATNPLGTVETTAELKIQEPPNAKFDENLKNVRLKSSSEYLLPVQVFGFPSPEIVWLKNERVLESSRHTLVQLREDSTTITIRQVENTDSATYTLQLSNPAGTRKYDFRLYVLDKPLPPEGPIAFHKIEKDSVTIGWQPPSIGGSEVLSYIIERCEAKRKTWIEVTSVTSGVLTCTIPDLTEGVEYAFRVLAVNEYGRSEPLTSDPVIPKSLFNKPLSPKGPFTSSNMTPTSFTLSWLAPDNDGGSPIIEYIVEKKEVNKKAWQKVGTTDSRSLSMEVTGLKKDTAYNFRVSCRNDVGTSPPYAPEEAITPGLKISPPAPPEGPLAITHMTNKTLTLSWKPPLNTGGAELTAYIIEKREATKKAWNRLETLDPHITSYTVHNLSDKHEYFFRVFAENPAGLSPPLLTEKPIKLTSTAERPTPPTAPLEMVATGPSSILIEWGKPESDGGSPLLGYTVALRDTRRIMWMEVGQVDGETQKLQIKDLQEGHEYLVRIMARNEVGISDPLEPEEPVKVIRPVGFKESEKMEVDEKTISVSYSTETSSSWIREANVEPLLRSYTKHVLVGRNEYFFKLWHFSESLYK